jgi:hypothetical protein
MNITNHMQDFTSQPRRPQSTSSLPWEPHITDIYLSDKRKKSSNMIALKIRQYNKTNNIVKNYKNYRERGKQWRNIQMNLKIVDSGKSVCLCMSQRKKWKSQWAKQDTRSWGTDPEVMV